MQSHQNKTQPNQNQAVANELAQKQGNGEGMQFVDNRPEAVAQRKLQESINNSSRVKQLQTIQAMANSSLQAKQAAQMQQLASQPIQKKENNTRSSGGEVHAKLPVIINNGALIQKPPIQLIKIGAVDDSPIRILENYEHHLTKLSDKELATATWFIQKWHYQEKSFSSKDEFLAILMEKSQHSGNKQQAGAATTSATAAKTSPPLTFNEVFTANKSNGFTVELEFDHWINLGSRDGTVNFQYILEKDDQTISFQIHVHPQVKGLGNDAIHIKSVGSNNLGGYNVPEGICILIGMTLNEIKSSAKSYGESEGWVYPPGGKPWMKENDEF